MPPPKTPTKGGGKGGKSPAKTPKSPGGKAKAQDAERPHPHRSRTMNLVEMNQQKELAALFAEIDVDNSGELERDEVKIMVERMGYPPMSEDQLDALFEQFDEDGSGTVNFVEFKHWWAAAQKAQQPTMTPLRRKRVQGYTMAAMRLCVGLHRAFLSMAGDAGALQSVTELEEVIHSVGIDRKQSRRRLQGCMDELNIGEGMEIDFATFISAFSLVGVRDDSNLEPPDTQQDGALLHVLRWQALRRAVQVTTTINTEGFKRANEIARHQRPGSSSHAGHLATERAAESAARRGKKEGHIPRALLVLGLRLETLRAGLGTGGVREDDDSDDEGEMQGHTHAFSQLLHSRMQKACEVFLQQFSWESGDVLLLSGARNYVEGNGLQPEDLLPTESALMLSFALDAGIPRASIELLENGCLNSIEVAITVKQLLTVMGSEMISIVTSDICLARAQTIYAALLPTFKVKFHTSMCPTMLVEHVDLVAEREGKLMAVLRDDLIAYLEYLEAGGVWPPRGPKGAETD